MSKPRGHWRTYIKARDYVRSRGVRGVTHFILLCEGKIPGAPRMPADIPRAPAKVYAGRGWVSWGGFLGTGTRYRHPAPLRPYAEASAYARSLKIQSGQAWDDFCAGRIPGMPPRPADIPADPAYAYRDCGWAGMPAFLDTENHQIKTKKRVMRPFEAARAFVQTFVHARTVEEYRAWCGGRIAGTPPRPADIPSNPQLTYRGRGWVSWPDFLGTGKGESPTMISAVLDILLR